MSDRIPQQGQRASVQGLGSVSNSVEFPKNRFTFTTEAQRAQKNGKVNTRVSVFSVTSAAKQLLFSREGYTAKDSPFFSEMTRATRWLSPTYCDFSWNWMMSREWAWRSDYESKLFPRNLSELLTTNTLEKAIAAAANIGSRPPSMATGISTTLYANAQKRF